MDLERLGFNLLNYNFVDVVVELQRGRERIRLSKISMGFTLLIPLSKRRIPPLHRKLKGRVRWGDRGIRCIGLSLLGAMRMVRLDRVGILIGLLMVLQGMRRELLFRQSIRVMDLGLIRLGELKGVLRLCWVQKGGRLLVNRKKCFRIRRVFLEMFSGLIGMLCTLSNVVVLLRAGVLQRLSCFETDFRNQICIVDAMNESIQLIL